MILHNKQIHFLKLITTNDLLNKPISVPFSGFSTQLPIFYAIMQSDIMMTARWTTTQSRKSVRTRTRALNSDWLPISLAIANIGVNKTCHKIIRKQLYPIIHSHQKCISTAFRWLGNCLYILHRLLHNPIRSTSSQDGDWLGIKVWILRCLISKH
jgi:hypothetical protein